MKELGGKALRNPLPVRARLEEIAGDSANAELLLQLAQRASHSDPEMSALAFQALKPLLHQVNPLHRRADLLRMFVMTSRNCEGAVDPAVLQEGFVLADLIRQDEKEAADRLPAGRRSPADELEAFLVAQLARDDYPSAIRYVRTLPPAERLRMLAQIVQTLQHN